ncbi:MAG TPA: hypothetical protein VF495_17725, partial [Phenylobacterium sp.]
MCHFITLVVASDDPDAVDAALRSHGRCATPVANPSLAAAMRADERQFLTNPRGCDCGTRLGAADAPEPNPATDHDRLRRKGWSEAKIARSLGDRNRAATHRAEAYEASHGLGLWEAVIGDVRALPGVSRVGLFVHCYRGAIEAEVLEPVRLDAPRTADVAASLQALQED